MTTRADFEAWLKDNPRVYAIFERYAIEAAKRGKLVGAKAIWERMRWKLNFETPGDELYKLNNNWTSWCVRKFKEAHPGYGMVFATRKSQADKEPLTATFPTKGGQGYMNW